MVLWYLCKWFIGKALFPDILKNVSRMPISSFITYPIPSQCFCLFTLHRCIVLFVETVKRFLCVSLLVVLGLCGYCFPFVFKFVFSCIFIQQILGLFVKYLG